MGRTDRQREHMTMKLGSSRHFIFGVLALGIVACGAALSDKSIEKEPTNVGYVDTKPSATSSSPLPPDVPEEEKQKKPEFSDFVSPAAPMTELAEGNSDEVDDWGDVVQTARPRGPADPMASGRKEDHPTISGGIAGTPRGATTTTTSSTGGQGSGVHAATEVRGTIDRAEIQRVVRGHLNEVKHCYDQGLTHRPDLEGRVVLKMSIGRTGSIVNVSVQDSSLGDRSVEACIVGAATKWVFPKPTGEGNVTISYPFFLKST